MAAVLSCEPDAFLSHRTAAELWGISAGAKGGQSKRRIEISVPAWRRPAGKGIRVHRVEHLPLIDRCRRLNLPVTSPVRTLFDLALELDTAQLETSINEADKLDLVDPDLLRKAVDERTGQHGVAAVRAVLDEGRFALTESELERSFLRLVAQTGLPLPLTQQTVNGLRVDFFWPELELVVETDGLRYHRTSSQQSKDRARDQRHAAAGLVVLRFTHSQVAFDANRVRAVLRAVAERQRIALLGRAAPS